MGSAKIKKKCKAHVYFSKKYSIKKNPSLLLRLHSGQRLLSRGLLRLFHRLSKSLRTLFAIDGEYGPVQMVAPLVLILDVESDFMAIVLRPYQDAAFVVIILRIDLIHIQKGEENVMNDDIVGSFEALINVDSPDNSLQCIAIGGIGGDVAVHPHHLGQAKFACQVVEAVAVDELGAHTGKHPLRFEGILVVQEISDNGAQNGVTEVLKPLVVEAASNNIVGRDRLMDKRYAEGFHIPDPESENILEIAPDFLVRLVHLLFLELFV